MAAWISEISQDSVICPRSHTKSVPESYVSPAYRSWRKLVAKQGNNSGKNLVLWEQLLLSFSWETMNWLRERVAGQNMLWSQKQKENEKRMEKIIKTLIKCQINSGNSERGRITLHSFIKDLDLSMQRYPHLLCSSSVYPGRRFYISGCCLGTAGHTLCLRSFFHGDGTEAVIGILTTRFLVLF